MFTRDKTRQVSVGPVAIGGGAAVSVQTMTTTATRDIDATVAQVNRLAEAGADIVRLAVPTKKDTAALPAILRQVSVPLVADVHFQFDRALEAVAAGVHKIRLNPGNIADRRQVRRVIDACRDRAIPIRIGVNEGSVIERRDKARRTAEKRMGLADLMVAKLADYIRLFEQADFHDIVLAAKSHNPATVIEVYRRIASRWVYPLHLGVTHAGPPQTGAIRSAVALGALLAEGIGDTIRVSFTADPVAEVQAGKEILCSLGLRRRTEPELISCPMCARAEADIISLTEAVRRGLAGMRCGIRVAVMGCVVNGPGEAEGADVALCVGRNRAVLYRDGVKVRQVRPGEMLDVLLAECRAWASDS